MKIRQLFKNVETEDIVGRFEGQDIVEVTCDSREVKSGVLFVAVRGSHEDGHRYIDAAVKQNAAAIVLEDRRFLPAHKPSLPYILVKNTKTALVKIADSFFDHPYQRIQSIGITGTNGKTTVSYLIRNMLNTAGIKCGLIGTIGYRIEDENVGLANTTPGVIELHRLVKKMVDAGDQYVVMEVSSHALDQERVSGITFAATIFTNLTQDHLDYHKTMEEYFCAKERLFKEHAGKTTSFIINRDDPFGRRLLDSLKGRRLSYGFSPEADVRADDFKITREGSRMGVSTARGKFDINTSLVGKHNLSNILAACAFGISAKMDFTVIKKGVEGVLSVPGRLERIDSKKGFSVFVDYAHTDDALKNVLESLRLILHNGRLITVFGCGGDRDKGKRPKMGKIASSLSDHCIITSDNPRSEDPRDIIRQIVSGIDKKNFQIEEDRSLAIQKALILAQPHDLILIAGKGHETYQIVKNKVYPFDDKAVVLEMIRGTHRV